MNIKGILLEVAFKTMEVEEDMLSSPRMVLFAAAAPGFDPGEAVLEDSIKAEVDNLRCGSSNGSRFSLLATWSIAKTSSYPGWLSKIDGTAEEAFEGPAGGDVDVCVRVDVVKYSNEGASSTHKA